MEKSRLSPIIVGAGFPRPQISRVLSVIAGRETKAMLFPLQPCQDIFMYRYN